MPASTSALLAAILLLASPLGPQVQIEWDRELAFDHDRDHYQRELRSIVERSHAFAAAELGLTGQRPLQVSVLTPAHFLVRFGQEAQAAQGARYQHGAIYVNGGRRLNDAFAGLMVHEMTHAVLDERGTSARLPLWLNEGLAERLRWRRQGMDELAPNQKQELQHLRREGLLIPLPAFGRVTFSYLQCYAATLFLERKAGRAQLLAVMRRTLDGEPFEKALDQALRWTQQDLERELGSWVDHLSYP